MSRTVGELAREVLARLERGEPLEEALGMALRGELDEPARMELETAGLRAAVVHEAFHALLDWHAGFGGLAEFAEIDEAIHRTAERIGHDLEDDDGPEHGIEGAARLVH